MKKDTNEQQNAFAEAVWFVVSRLGWGITVGRYQFSAIGNLSFWNVQSAYRYSARAV